MITDQDAEDAVEFLENNAIEAAQARADRIYCEQFRNTVKAQLMTTFDDGSTPAVIQERKAYADPRYMQQLDAIQEAVFRDEKAKFLREAAQAKLSAWQTLSANTRTRP